MIQYEDHRMLTICLVTNSGHVLLEDERQEAFNSGDYITERRRLPGWDAELAIYRITGKPGGVIPKDPYLRETLREGIKARLQGANLFTVRPPQTYAGSHVPGSLDDNLGDD